MTTMQKTITDTPHSWAGEAGARFATRRAERERERLEAAEAEEGRRQLTAAALQQRFAATARLVLEAVDAFAAAAGIRIEAAPAAAKELELRGAGDERLRLRRVDDAIVVMVRGVSPSVEFLVDLSADAYSPADTARGIAEPWIQVLTAAEEARHA